MGSDELLFTVVFVFTVKVLLPAEEVAFSEFTPT